MRRTIITLVFSLILAASGGATVPDSILDDTFKNIQWHIGAEGTIGKVPGTNNFLRGDNIQSKQINKKISEEIRAGFKFSEKSKYGILYSGIYQGIGVGINSFFSPILLGTPVSIFVYQGAPIVGISNRFWLGYEWKFGAAAGWKHHGEIDDYYNASVSTSVTAMMELGIKLNYSISEKFNIWLGVSATHYSNGNTSWPNGGINSIGPSVGAVYSFTTQPKMNLDTKSIKEEADRKRWFYDIMVYGAWRKRAVNIGFPKMTEMCPGKFGVVGLQLLALRTLNRWVAVGPGLEIQWDESAGLSPYWVEGTHDDYLKFIRPPFGKQIKTGISAHGELTTPIFAINAGLGYDFINPKGDSRFYQSLTLKTFLSKNLYLNVGYRLGDFSYPQNLMLGVGVRIR